MQAAGGPSFIPRWAAATPSLPQTEFGNTVPHPQTSGTANRTYCHDVKGSIDSYAEFTGEGRADLPQSYSKDEAVNLSFRPKG